MFKFLKVVILLVFGLVSSRSMAQVSYSAYESEKNLDVKSEMGLELWNYYVRFHLDSLKIAAVDLLLEASDKKHDFARSVGSRMLGSYLYRTGKIKQGLEYLEISQKYFLRMEDNLLSSEVYNELGNANLLLGDYSKAKKMYANSLRFGALSSDATAAYNGKLGLGKTYVAMGDTSAGLNIIQQYKQLAIQQQKFEAASDALAYLGMIENERGNLNLSLDYYLRSVYFSKQSKSKIHLSHCYSVLGILKFEMEEFDASLDYFQKSLDLRLEMNAMRPIIEGYNNLGFFYQMRNDPEKAIGYYLTAIKLANEHQFASDELEIIVELVPLLKAAGDLKQATSFEARKKDLEKYLADTKKGELKELRGIQLDFSTETKKKNPKQSSPLDWKVLVIIVLCVGVLALIYAERNRFS